MDSAPRARQKKNNDNKGKKKRLEYTIGLKTSYVIDDWFLIGRQP